MENKVDISDLKTIILETQEYYNELENSICYEEELIEVLKAADMSIAFINYLIYIKENNIDSIQVINDEEKIIIDYYEKLSGFDKDIFTEVLNFNKELKDGEKSEDPTSINLLEKDVNELTIILIALKEVYLTLGLVYPLSRFREIKKNIIPAN